MTASPLTDVPSEVQARVLVVLRHGGTLVFTGRDHTLRDPHGEVSKVLQRTIDALMRRDWIAFDESRKTLPAYRLTGSGAVALRRYFEDNFREARGGE